MSPEHAFGLLRILERDGFVIYPTKGVSMYPLLREGKTLVRLEALSEDPSIYDVVLFKRRDALVLHRVVALKKDYFYICGDNSKAFEKVPRGDVKAVMRGYFREDGGFTAADSPENVSFTARRWKDFCDRPFFEESAARSMIENEDPADYLMFAAPEETGGEPPRLPTNKEALQIIRRHKRRCFWRRIFPPFEKLKTEYPVLEKAPVLLPFVWVSRCFKKVFRPRKHS